MIRIRIVLFLKFMGERKLFFEREQQTGRYRYAKFLIYLTMTKMIH